MKRIVWVALVVLLSACGPTSPPQTGALTSPSGTAASSSPSPSPSSSSGVHQSPSPTALACWPLHGGASFANTVRPAITDVRVGTHGPYDRLVVEFTNVGLPSYQLMPNPVSPGGGTTFIEDASSRPVTVDGNYGVLLKISDLDWTNDSYPSGRELKPGYPVLKEVRVTGDYEAVVSIGIGLRGDVCPSITEMNSPLRLVIDFPTA